MIVLTGPKTSLKFLENVITAVLIFYTLKNGKTILLCPVTKTGD